MSINRRQRRLGRHSEQGDDGLAADVASGLDSEDTLRTDDADGPAAAVLNGREEREGGDDQFAGSGEDGFAGTGQGDRPGTTVVDGRVATRPRPAPSGTGRVRPRQFLHEVNVELRKVAWPSRAETINYSSVVFVTLAVLMALIFGLDYGFNRLALFLFK